MNQFNFTNKKDCESKRNKICYLCAQYIRSTKNFDSNSDFVRKLVKNVFPDFKFPGVKSSWARDFVCQKCTSALGRSTKPYESPAIWSKCKADHSDCYFCLSKFHPTNRIHNSSFSYPTNSCVITPTSLKVTPSLEIDNANPVEEADDSLDIGSNDLTLNYSNLDESFHLGNNFLNILFRFLISI